MFEFFNTAVIFFNIITDFMFSGIYDFVTQLFSIFFVFIGYVFYEITSIMMGLSWDIAKDIISLLNISSVIQNAWSSVDESFMNYLSFFRVPEAFNNIFSAYVTRFVMKFTVPWI